MRRGRGRERGTPWVRLLGVGLLLVAPLAGCGSGQLPQTSYQQPTVGGINGGVGTMQVRDAQIDADGRRVVGNVLYRPGEDAPIQVTIVDEAAQRPPGGPGPDRLVAVSSPVARAGRIVGDPQIPDGLALVSGYRRPGTLPGEYRARGTGTREVGIALTGLTAPVRPGLDYPVTFTFARAGSVTLDVPVENPDPAGS